MQEQERLANEEAEKRLKAALLTAKREPSTTQSRVASPFPNNSTDLTSESKLVSDTPPTSEDVLMEDPSSIVSTNPEVQRLPFIVSRS